MKKSVCVFILTTVILPAAVYGQGFTGPGSEANTARVQTVTVVQANDLPEKSLVILTGSIVQSLGREKYKFRDSTGDITIEVERDLWALLGLSVSAADRIEIRGKIDYENRTAEIEVKSIQKL